MRKPRVLCLINTAFSGSTLMSLLLDSHPQVATVGEGINPRTFRAGGSTYPCSCGAYLLRCPFWTGLERAVNDRGIDFRIPELRLDYKHDRALARRFLSEARANRLVDRVSRTVAELAPWSRARLARLDRINLAFVRSALEATGKDVFFAATKNLVGNEYWRRHSACDVRFLRIVRDARSFIGSCKRRGRPVRAAALEWRRYQRSADRFVGRLPAGRVVRMRYEDLCDEPARCLRELYAAIGVEYVDPPAVLTPSAHHITGNGLRLAPQLRIRRIDRRAELTPAELATVTRLVGETRRRVWATPVDGA